MNRYRILKHPELEPCTSEQAEQDFSKELEKNFASIRRWDLKVNSLICSVCGNVTNFDAVDAAGVVSTPLCEHLAFIFNFIDKKIKSLDRIKIKKHRGHTTMQIPLSWFKKK